MEKKNKHSFSIKKSDNLKKRNFSNKIKILSEKFIIFLQKYRTIDNFQCYFSKKFKKNFNGNIKIITIDLFHIAQFDSVLYFYILKYPTEMISICDYAINKFLELKWKKKKIFKKKIKISFLSSIKNQVVKLESLSPEQINKIVVVEGIVIKFDHLSPELTTAFFRCQLCNFETYYFIEKGKLLEPVYCFNCKNFNSFQLILNRSSFTDRKYFFIQEIINAGLYQEFPSTLLLIANETTFDKIKIGDFIKAIGILRVLSLNEIKISTSKLFFNFYLDILNVKIKNSKNLNFKNFKVEKFFSNKKIKYQSNNEITIMMNSLIQNPKIYKNYFDSIIFGLIGLETIKQVILLILLKIIWTETNQGSYFLINKTINLLLMGNTRIIKSYILKFIPKIFQEIFYFEGKNINVLEKTKSDSNLKEKNDKFDGLFNLIFSKNSGIFSINDIDKLPKNLFEIFHEILNYQVIPIINNCIILPIKTNISMIGTIDLSIYKETNDLKKKKNILMENFKPFFNSFELIYFLKESNSSSNDINLANQVFKFFFSLKKKRFKKFIGIGFQKKAFCLFLNNFQNYSMLFFSALSIKELLKWEIMYFSIKNFKQENFRLKQFEINELLIKISFVLSLLRFSPSIGVEDVRYSMIILIEALKSLKNFISHKFL
jgi:DNA replication licensing factor MCM4